MTGRDYQHLCLSTISHFCSFFSLLLIHDHIPLQYFITDVAVQNSTVTSILCSKTTITFQLTQLTTFSRWSLQRIKFSSVWIASAVTTSLRYSNSFGSFYHMVGPSREDSWTVRKSNPDTLSMTLLCCHARYSYFFRPLHPCVAILLNISLFYGPLLSSITIFAHFFH